MKKWFRCVLFLCVGLLLAGSTLVYAEPAADPLWAIAGEKADPPEVNSPTAILIDKKTGVILYQKDANTAYHPASITKVMTALLTLENCSMDETVKFSYRATHELEDGATHIARTEDEEMCVKDCLYALLLASANEVAQALAEHISGTIEDFGVKMTERAKELGCTNTCFKNPSGLNDEDHFTTAHDMAIIMRQALNTPGFLEIDSTTVYEIPPTNKHSESTWVATKHPLLKGGDTPYDYAIAGKTGYTQIAGNSLVTYAKKDDAELICVIMNSQKGNRSSDTKNLFEYGFNNFTWYSMADDARRRLTEGSNADGPQVECTVSEEDAWVVLPNTVKPENLTAKVEQTEGADGFSGTIAYSINGEKAGAVHFTGTVQQPVTQATEPETTTQAPESESEGGFSWMKILMWVGIGLAVLLVAFGIFFVAYNWQQIKHRRRSRSRYKRKRRRRRW